MDDAKTDVLLIGAPKPVIVDGLAGAFNLLKFSDAGDREQFFAGTAPRLRAIAVTGTSERIDAGAPAPTPVPHPRSASALTLAALIDRFETLRRVEVQRIKTLDDAMPPSSQKGHAGCCFSWS